jgi:hypothetical protein
VDYLELRQERDQFQHQYVLVGLRDGSSYRFDRRPDPKVPVDTVMRAGCKAVDTVQEVLSVGDMTLSNAIVRVQLDESVDLSLVLLICYAIATDEKAQRYTLQKFNCYFLAWTILVVVIRRAELQPTLPYIGLDLAEERVHSWGRRLHSLVSAARQDSTSESFIRWNGGTVDADDPRISDALQNAIHNTLYDGTELFIRKAWKNSQGWIRNVALEAMRQTIRAGMDRIVVHAVRTAADEALKATLVNLVRYAAIESTKQTIGALLWQSSRSQSRREALWVIVEELRDKVRQNVRESLLDVVQHLGWDGVQNRLEKELKKRLGRKLESRLIAELGATLTARLELKMEGPLRDELEDVLPLAMHAPSVGNHSGERQTRSLDGTERTQGTTKTTAERLTRSFLSGLADKMMAVPVQRLMKGISDEGAVPAFSSTIISRLSSPHRGTTKTTTELAEALLDSMPFQEGSRVPNVVRPPLNITVSLFNEPRYKHVEHPISKQTRSCQRYTRKRLCIRYPNECTSSIR